MDSEFNNKVLYKIELTKYIPNTVSGLLKKMSSLIKDNCPACRLLMSTISELSQNPLHQSGQQRNSLSFLGEERLIPTYITMT